ncbi:MAG: alpha/beta fold hydrolase [Patescibacteria group bacterium]
MRNKIKIFLTTILSLWGVAGFCYASTIFKDDFNSYTIDSILGGQGEWISSSGTVIASNPTKEGAAAVKMTHFVGSGENAKRSGTLLNDGKITVYLRRHIGGTTSPHFDISLKGGTIDRIKVKTGGLDFRYWNGSDFVNFGPFFTSDTWHAVQIQWRSVDHKARYNIGGGTWTEWAPVSSAWSSGIDTIDITGTDGVMYFDTIQEDLIGQEKNPVLIVPGLMGTEIESGDELLWIDLGRMLTDIGDDFMDKLSFNTNLSPSDQLAFITNVIRSKTLGPIKFDYTDGLIDEFSKQGYIENETLFTFPYDWRYGISGKFEDGTTAVDLLGQKINDIVEQTGSDKVDVVAHSMGGLLVKKYVMDNLANHHINKAVFVGVPNTGAPAAIKTLLQGDDFGIPWLSENEIKKIAENMPVAYDLLPSQKYYDFKGSFVKVIDERNFSLSNPEVTVTDLDYSQFKNYITLDHQLNSNGLAGAESIHIQNFDDFDLRTAGVDVYAIDGCRAATVTDIIERKSKNILGFEITNYDVKFGTGDSTVPLESATNLPINQNNKYYALVSNHSRMLSQSGIRQQITNLLSGSNLSVSGDIITQNVEECKLNGNLISVFSPINISVLDQSGNYLGLAEDGSITNQIPNAALEILGEHKFLYLPTNNNQTYEININGTREGSFTIKNQEIINGQVAETEVFSNLPVTNELTGQINLGDSTTLIIQQNSTDEPKTILPSSVVDANQSQDLLPPISNIEILGTTGQSTFYRSDVSVNIKAVDQISGVLNLRYKVDGSSYNTADGNEATIDLLKEGMHTISFFATDRAGNNEPQKILNFTIDKTPPEAIIEFDPVVKDLKIIGTDNISSSDSIVINDKDDVILLSDLAGNTTEIYLKEKNKEKSMSAEVKLLKYNGTSVDISKNQMKFSLSYDKNQNLKKLFQTVKSKKDYSIQAVYNGTQTKISGKDSLGTISETINGLQIIKVSTKKGDLMWSY